MRQLSRALLVVAAACSSSRPAPPTTPTPASPAAAASTSPSAPASTPTAAAPSADVCGSRPDEYGPVELSAEQAPRRYGQQAVKFGDTPSTKEKPIEVCGVPEQRQWLMQTSCADGSKAFKEPREVAASRRGNVGPGGRCGSIIDAYVVKCPEAEYEVFMDMYMCPAGQQAF